ncbi:MAG TPA: hypothetical protein VM030_03965, partial [Acidimicrobiales bacterium]|nr:hypothetical protein [Acidimicrobiales bacterium]
MSDEMTQALFSVVRVVEILVFSGLAVLAVLRHRRERSKASRWLAATFGVLGGIVLLGAAIPKAPSHPELDFLRRALLMALFLFPFFLVRFTGTFARVRRSVRLAVIASLVAIEAVTLFLPLHVDPEAPRPAWVNPYLVVALVFWTTLTTVATRRLWKGGRGQPTVARRRMRTMGVGAVLLNIALLLSGFIPPDPASLAFPLFVKMISQAAALMFFVAFAMPAGLRSAWRKNGIAELHRAEADLMLTTHVESVAVLLLPRASELLGGKGSCIVAHDGSVTAAHEMTAEELLGVQALVANERHVPNPQVRGHWVILALASGWLVVGTTNYTPVFGHAELSLLLRLGHVADLALQRAALISQERSSRDALVERERQLGDAQRVARLGS